MPLTRFADHDEKRVFLSTVLTFNLPPADSVHSDRLSVAVFWIDEGTPSARELSLDFAVDMMDHGALAIVCGGTGAEAAARLFESAVEAGEFVRGEGEEIGIQALPAATLEQVLWTAAEEAMPPDAYADRPWDIVVWARSGDAKLPALKEALPRLSEIVEEIYDQGGEDE